MKNKHSHYLYGLLIILYPFKTTWEREIERSSRVRIYCVNTQLHKLCGSNIVICKLLLPSGSAQHEILTFGSI